MATFCVSRHTASPPSRSRYTATVMFSDRRDRQLVGGTEDAAEPHHSGNRREDGGCEWRLLRVQRCGGCDPHDRDETACSRQQNAHRIPLGLEYRVVGPLEPDGIIVREPGRTLLFRIAQDCDDRRVTGANSAPVDSCAGGPRRRRSRSPLSACAMKMSR